MNKCTEACVDHQKVLHTWTKHSHDGTISWKSRVKIGFSKERHIKAVLGQIQGFKSSLTSVIGVATFFVSIRNSSMAAEIKKEFDARISDVLAVAAANGGQIASAEQALREVERASIEDSERDEEDEEKVAAEIASSDQLAALRTSEEMTKEFLTKLNPENVERMFKNYQGNTNTVTFGQNRRIQSKDNRGSISGNTLEYAYPPG